jgi:hypothetical protein
LKKSSFVCFSGGGGGRGGFGGRGLIMENFGRASLTLFF